MVTTNDKRQARLETRLRLDDKRFIEAAAAAEGLSLSDFVLLAVKHHAQDVLARQQRIQLSVDVSHQFTRMLMDSTTEPPVGLRDAMLRHDALIESAD